MFHSFFPSCFLVSVFWQGILPWFLRPLDLTVPLLPASCLSGNNSAPQLTSALFRPLFFSSSSSLTSLQAALSGLATVVSKKIGRIPTICLFDTLGIGCLVMMVVLRDVISPLPLATIYVIRTGLMNSTYPLANSIMMDCCAPLLLSSILFFIPFCVVGANTCGARATSQGTPLVATSYNSQQGSLVCAHVGWTPN